MSIRPKTRKRLLIIGLVLFASSAAIGMAYYFKQQQKLKHLVAQRDQGLEDYAQGKYIEAFNKLSVWLKDPNRHSDPELIYKFADSCLQTRDMENHIQIARNWFSNYSRLRPDDIRGYQNLMDIYYDNRSYTEAIDNADKIIECYAKADPGAQESLQETVYKARKIRIKSQVSLSRFEDALADANAFQKSRPDDVEINRIIIGSLANLKRGSEVIPMATAIYKADPNSPKSLYLLSMAYALNNDFNIEDRTAAWELTQAIDTNSRIRKNVLGESVNIDNFSRVDAAVICIMKAAALINGETPITQLISSQLDALGLYNESIAVMLKTNPQDQSPWVQSELIARLYECDLYDEVLKRLEKLRVNVQNPTFSNIILMTIKAQCHIVKGQKAEALAISKDLASCPKIDDYVDRIIRAWVDLIGYLCGDQRIESSKLIGSVAPAVNNPRYDGYMAFILGNLYSEIGEVDLAIEAFNKAKNSRPTWYAPRLKLSRLYLAVGQKQNAENEANAAHRCYRFTLTFTNLLSVVSAINPDSMLDEDFMKKIAEYNKQSPNDPQILPIYLKSLVQSGKSAEAETIVRNLIADEKTQATDLVRLADLSHSLKLKVDEECLVAAEKKFGLLSEVALMRVSFLIESNKRDEAYAYYEQARAKAPKNDNPIAWKFGYAKILDRFNDPKAVDAWKNLAEDPDLPKTNAYVMVLKTILGSATAQNDQDLIAKTIDRLKNTTGENAIIWRIAEARFLIKERSKESLTKAKSLLEETLKSVPSNMDARLLLAGVCDELGDTTSAINNLVEVARSRPEPQYIIQLASLYNKVQDINNARQTLNRLPRDSSISDSMKVQAASLWIQIGEPERAREISANISLTEDNPELSLLAIEMELASGQIAKAEERISNLLKKPTASVLISAARFYHLTNRDSIASDVLKKFDDLKLEPGMKEYYLGEYAGSVDDSKTAIDNFSKAASLQPSRVECQISYILALIQAGEIEKALAVSDQASRSLNNYKPLEDFRKQRALLISLSANPLAIRLAREILRNPPDSLAAAKSLETLYAVYKLPKEQQVEKLKPIADGALKLFPLQEYIIGLYEQLGRRDDAAAVAVRAAQSNPNSPETAYLAALSLYRAGDYRQSLSYAEKWKNLTPNQTPPIMLAVDNLIYLGDYNEALKRLEPVYAPIANEISETTASIHQKRLSILVRKKDFDTVEKFIRANISNERVWIITLTLTLDVSDPVVISRWIDMVAQAIPKNNVNENIRVSIALQDAGVRLKQDDFIAKSKSMIQRIAEQNPQNPDANCTAGIQAANIKDYVAAENYYRKAISVSPGHVIAINNLAMLLAEQNKNIEEASSLINQIKENEKFPAILDTQSFILFVKKDYAQAQSVISRAIAAEPSNPTFRLRLIEILLASNKNTEAAAALRDMELIHKSLFPEDAIQRRDAIRAKINPM